MIRLDQGRRAVCSGRLESVERAGRGEGTGGSLSSAVFPRRRARFRGFCGDGVGCRRLRKLDDEALIAARPLAGDDAVFVSEMRDQTTDFGRSPYARTRFPMATSRSTRKTSCSPMRTIRPLRLDTTKRPKERPIVGRRHYACKAKLLSLYMFLRGGRGAEADRREDLPGA